MIFLFIVAALAALLTFALSILPGPDFFALPAAATSAMETAGGVGGFFLGLAGEDVKAAALTILPLFLGVKIAVLLWTIIRNWKPPIVGKYL